MQLRAAIPAIGSAEKRYDDPSPIAMILCPCKWKKPYFQVIKVKPPFLMLWLSNDFFQMFWPQTWSKQNFKSLNHFTFLFLASFLQKWLLHLLFKQIKPQICWFITFSVLWNHHFSPFKSSTTGAAETHAVVCGRGLVPAAWSTARPLLGVWGGGTSLSLEIFGMILGISQFFFFFRGNGRK